MTLRKLLSALYAALFVIGAFCTIAGLAVYDSGFFDRDSLLMFVTCSAVSFWVGFGLLLTHRP